MSNRFYDFSTNNIVLRVLEHMSYIKLVAKYSSHKYTYSNLIISKLISNKQCTALSKYKDYLMLYSRKEQLRRFYYKCELNIRLTKICKFYDNYSRVFPNYIILCERKYIYKNIRKKQKRIDAVNKLKYEKNMIKEYLKDNNCFDNEVFKGPLFTEEVEFEIAKDNMLNNSNNNNNLNEDDTLFTQNSFSLFEKNDKINNNKYNNSDTNNTNSSNNNNKNINIKNGISIDSFITNNESIFNIMDVLNDNKIYVNDLKLLLLNDNKNTKNNNYIQIGNKFKYYEGIKQMLKYENEKEKNNEKNQDKNNEKNNINIDQCQSNKESESIYKREENPDQNINNAIQNNNQKTFQMSSTESGKMKKTKKKIKNKCNANDNNNINTNHNNNSNNKAESIKKNKRKNNCFKKFTSPENNNNNTKNSKEKITSSNNIKDYIHLQTISGLDNNLLTKNKIYYRKTDRKISKHKNKAKSKTKEKKEDNLVINKKLSINKFRALKKYIRYKHVSQDLTNNNVSRDKEDSLRAHNSAVNNNIDKTNTKLRKKVLNSKTNIGISSILKTHKNNIANIKKVKKPQIINNQIIIQNNNNYFLTENNNPNLITGTRNNYETDDCDNEREKLIIYLKDIAESQKVTQLQRLTNSQKKSKNIGYILESINTDNNASNKKGNIYINDSHKKKRKKDDFLQKLSKQKTEKKFKKNYKYYLNHLNYSSKISNIINISKYSITKYNTIRKVHYHKRNNSNFTGKKIKNSINSVSKIKKYNSNCSMKTEDLISPNKNIFPIKTINCYSYNDSKNKNKYKNNLISKNNTIKLFKSNRGFAKTIDMIFSDSSRNILSQRLRKKKLKDFTISLIKDESKNSKNSINKILAFDKNNIKNLTLSAFNKENNEINEIKNQNNNNKKKSYNNKKRINDNSTKKNQFSSCDFDAIKNTYTYTNNFSKGLLDRINNIKKKINEGINKKKINQNIKLKKENTQKIYFNKVNNNNTNNNNYIRDTIIYNSNENKEKKNYNKSKKIYENKMSNNDNKENCPPQCLIKVNKTKNLGNTNSHFHFYTEI